VRRCVEAGRSDFLAQRAGYTTGQAAQWLAKHERHGGAGELVMPNARAFFVCILCVKFDIDPYAVAPG
jgi:hypothetical protein